MAQSDPVLLDVRPAIEVVPGMTRTTILTSGPPLPWADYIGGQRDAIIGAVRFENLAETHDEAVAKLDAGDITVGGCHDYGCIGSLAGVYSASMNVFVVENRAFGNRGFCNIYEGANPRRLNYGVYDEGVRERLLFVENTIAPVVAKAVRRSGGISLKVIMARALHMGDELHSRNTAASLLFTRELFPNMLEQVTANADGVGLAVKAMTEDNYFFLRLSMAACKTIADASHGIEGSSVVTAMAFNCRNFALRVSGLGDDWILGPHADVEAKLFEGHSEDEISWMGGESIIAETVGLGGFAQAAAFPLQKYQGGSAEAMVRRNLDLYDITVGEHPDFHIPYLGYRGTPTAIDIFRVVDTDIMPVMNIGVAGRDGGQIGAGIVRAPKVVFESARKIYRERYGD
ncbi:MAG TPA: DUF1116 domain-containing protein [Gammaproteobacteria bacterium]|jgi:hypothetical protein|nr:DUF1116 domain-containing protein [Gammaproteobacteria bacterium]HIN17226.1 DUF1116 domain-containing protein [Gammaproteobacteria bacterium]